MQRAYKRQYQQTYDLIKKVMGEPEGDIEARVLSAVGAESASLSSISQIIQQVLSQVAAPRIIEGFNVVATTTPGIEIEVNTDSVTGKSKGVANGSYIETTTSYTLSLLPYLGIGPKSIYVSISSSTDVPELTETKGQTSLILAKIVIPDSSTVRIFDDKPDFGSDGYIISGRDLLFENNYIIDDYTIELFRDSFSKIAADNIVEGSLICSEQLKVTNVSGSAELGSAALDFYGSSGDHLAHYGADEAWIGQILITDSTIQSRNFFSNVSGFRIKHDGDAEFNNVKVRGELHSAVFVYDETHALNGYMVISNVSILETPINTTTTTMVVKDDVFANGDILLMRSPLTGGGWNVEYVKVTSGGGTTVLTVTRDFDGTGANSWDEGTVVVSTDSRIEISSAGQSDEPFLDVIERTGSTTYDEQEVRLRLGNLSGITDADFGTLSGYGLYADNAYFKGQVVISGGSGIEALADFQYSNNFQEYFDDPNGDVATRWPSYSGSGEESIQAGGLTGGKFYRIGDNSGNDNRWMIYYKSLPYDESKLYRIRCRIRQTAGSGTCYIGVAGRNGDDDAWVNITGADLDGNQHYIAANGVNPGSSWTTYTGYFSGRAASGNGGDSPYPADPATLHDDVRYFRPLIGVNYNAVAGTYEIDEFSIDIMPDQLVYWSQAGQTTWMDGGNIWTNTIYANAIAANTITAAEIAANTITAAELAATTITAAQINGTGFGTLTISSGTITLNGGKITLTASDAIEITSGGNIKINAAAGLTIANGASIQAYSGSDLLMDQGADIIMSGGASGNPSLIRFADETVPGEMRWEKSSDFAKYWTMYKVTGNEMLRIEPVGLTSPNLQFGTTSNKVYNLQSWVSNSVSFDVGGYSILEIYPSYLRVNGDLDPVGGGSNDFGNATNYWNDISYKTLTDRGCLGWFDDGVEMPDGSIVTDMEALKAIQKDVRPGKDTVYGVPMLDYRTMPKAVYKPGGDKSGVFPRDANDEPYTLDAEGKKVPAADGSEVTALLSIVIGALKEVDARVSVLEAA